MYFNPCISGPQHLKVVTHKDPRWETLLKAHETLYLSILGQKRNLRQKNELIANNLNWFIEEEFQNYYLNGYTNILQPGGAGAARRTHNINVNDLPTEIDWREKESLDFKIIYIFCNKNRILSFVVQESKTKHYSKQIKIALNTSPTNEMDYL